MFKPAKLIIYALSSISLLGFNFCYGDSTVMFRYEDDSGTLHYSDEVPLDVPENKVKTISFHETIREAIRKLSKTELKKVITQLAEDYRVEGALIEAIVKAESAYDPMAVSKKGARGLMQLMPATAESLGVSNLHDPKENLRGGIRYLKSLMDRYKGDQDLAVAAYNAGPGAVSKYNGVPPFAETVDYVRKVRKYYEEFRERGSLSATNHASPSTITLTAQALRP